jgi:hypothetical protein
MRLHKKIFIGIDQTGAVDRQGRPVALPACVLRDGRFSLCSLKTLSFLDLKEHCTERELQTAVIAVDCVFGVPKSIGKTLKSSIQSTQALSGYGREVAQKFFRSLGDGKTPKREVEVLCNANSIFKERPFQKNIQTGTYRIWKELGSAPSLWYSIPTVAGMRNEQAVTLLEGYPTLSWRLLFGAKTRQPECLAQLIRDFDPELSFAEGDQRKASENPNFADALVLSLAAREHSSGSLKRAPSREGWILGAELRRPT